MKEISDSQKSLLEEHIDSEKISATRTLFFLGATLYMLFAIVDYISVSVALSEVLLIRGSVTIVMAIIIALTYHKIFTQYYDLIVSFAYIAAAGSIISMIYLAQPDDYASKVYFAGLLLVIMTVFSWAYFKISTSVIVIGAIISAYLYVGLYKRMEVELLFVNIVFLISAASIGFMSQMIRDRYLRENFILQQSLKSAVKEKTEEAKDNAYLANHDALTGLPNRRYITELLEKSLEKAQKENRVLAILFLDLNGFKQVNDIYGHAFGDEVLKIVAKRLELAIRQGDYLSRLGGDEYLISLMLNNENLSEVEVLAEKFTALITQPMNIDGMKIKIGASIGIAAYPMHGNKVSVLMDIADKKMYQIKGSRKQEEEEKKERVEPIVIFPGNTGRRN